MAKRRVTPKAVVIDISKRDCPICHQSVSWTDSDTGTENTAESWVMCAHPDCTWEGPYCDTLIKTVFSDVAKRPNIRAALFATLEEAEHKEVCATRAYAEIVQNIMEDVDGHSDPNDHGRRVFEGHAKKLSELWVLTQMIHLWGLGLYKDRIMHHAIARAYPTVTIKR